MNENTLPEPKNQDLNLIAPLRLITGFLSLLLRSASEATRIAGEIHGVINQKPGVLAKTDPNLGDAPKLYQLINLTFIHAANQLHKLIEKIPTPAVAPPELIRLQGVMNGVFGDKLRDWGHPGAITMHLVDETHQTIELKRLQANHPNGVVIFVHGLCLSEYEWRKPPAKAFAKLLNQHGYGVAYLRYNTGLTLTENGEHLADLLNYQWQANQSQRLLLVGHSMGGLISRSALHIAQDIFHQAWVKDVSHIACVASPHEGANLEKLGNFANNLLGHSPYTKPLMALGNIRSRGIRSLRESNIKHDSAIDTDNMDVFNADIHHLLIAAQLPEPISKQVFGDGLVTELSAMGPSHFPEEHDQITRLVINEIGHLKLLSDDRLYWALTLWLFKTT